MRFIAQFTEGYRVSDVYLVKHRQIAVTKNGKEYANVVLQDRTGTIDAKIWDLTSPGIGDFDALDYTWVEGDVTVYQGSHQLNIRRIRRAEEGEYRPSDYLPVSPRDLKEMYQELKALVMSMENPWLRKLSESYYVEDKEFLKAFCYHSAAKSVHHGFVGGLMQHTLSVMNLCDYMAKAHPLLDRDLLLTAALFHDIGKVSELSDFPENDYTDEGQLIGHIIIGAQMVHDRIRTIEGFPARLARELEHCILAHHGELEYGSPKKPALLEALALSFADNTDAKMETMMEALSGGTPVNKNGWLGFNRFLESNIRPTGEPGAAGQVKAAGTGAPGAEAAVSGNAASGSIRRGEEKMSDRRQGASDRFSNRIEIPGLNG
ncbi:MAG: HD domain-containing protein [Clostridium sp.]|nr:HD domain-containing protein [Clostridium sp.]